MKESLKEELTELGQKIKEIAIKYHEDYLTVSYVDGSIIGNNSTAKPEKEQVSIWIDGEENE